MTHASWPVCRPSAVRHSCREWNGRSEKNIFASLKRLLLNGDHRSNELLPVGLLRYDYFMKARHESLPSLQFPLFIFERHFRNPIDTSFVTFPPSQSVTGTSPLSPHSPWSLPIRQSALPPPRSSHYARGEGEGGKRGGSHALGRGKKRIAASFLRGKQKARSGFDSSGSEPYVSERNKQDRDSRVVVVAVRMCLD